MKFSIIKEYFLYRLYYHNTILALDEFHEFCDHVNNYGLEYKDILVYRKNYAIALLETKMNFTDRAKLFYELMKKEVQKC